MAIDFSSARRKLARAKEHFQELNRQLADYLEERPYQQIIEPDPANAEQLEHKIKITKPLPDSLGDVVGDVVTNLRAALDHATYALAAEGKTEDPKNAAFPFARTEPEFENSLKGRAKDVPAKYYDLLRSFKPYKGGNEVLWGLNMICNADKHKMLTPVGMAVRRAGIAIEGVGWFSAPLNPTWDRSKNEIVVLTVHKETKINYKFPFRMFVVFENVELVGGEPVDSILQQTIDEVERVLGAIEAEAAK
jgi:hypothetical protein